MPICPLARNCFQLSLNCSNVFYLDCFACWQPFLSTSFTFSYFCTFLFAFHQDFYFVFCSGDRCSCNCSKCWRCPSVLKCNVSRHPFQLILHKFFNTFVRHDASNIQFTLQLKWKCHRLEKKDTDVLMSIQCLNSDVQNSLQKKKTRKTLEILNTM